MSFHHATEMPRWVTGCEFKPFDASSGIIYPFGDVAKNYWLDLGRKYTALALCIYVESGSCSATPEVTCDQELSVADTGEYAPKVLTVGAGQLKSAQYGIDLVRVHWRVALNGGVGKVGWLGIPR